MKTKKDQASTIQQPGGCARPTSSPEPSARSACHGYRASSAGKSSPIEAPSARDHAAWDPPANRPDPVDLLEAQAATRIPELVPIRYGRMLASPFAFYRGAAAIMASDLASMPNTGLQVQLCGDAHLANFGGFASPERELILDINDFDETLPGPWEWDVKRLAASVEIAGRERSFDAKTRRGLVLGIVGEYHRAMREFARLGQSRAVVSAFEPGSDTVALGDVGKTQGHESVRGELLSSLSPGQPARLREAHPPGEWPAADRCPPAVGRPDRRPDIQTQTKISSRRPYAS